jgi:hypothetical protein
MVVLVLSLGAAASGIAFVATVREAPSAQPAGAPDAAKNRADAPAAPAGGIGAGLPARPVLGDSGVDLFPAPGRVTAETQGVKTAPSPPAAPPLPFRFIGRVYQEGETQAYVARGAKVYAVKKGDVVDNDYRVEKLGATEMVFMHIPSGSRQVMQFTPPIEGASEATRTARAGPE